MQAVKQGAIDVRAHGIGLKTAMKILAQWKCSPEQCWNVLGMKKSNYYKLRDAPETAKLSGDQLERVSYILNIHQALRVIFDNPENVNGFMGMENHNPYFNGKSPLELIGTGRFAALYEVFNRINALRGAGL